MILSDRDLLTLNSAVPLTDNLKTRLDTCGIKVTLNNVYYEVSDDGTYHKHIFRDGVILKKDHFYLMSTREFINVPINYCAFLHGRSTLGRHGLLIHVTAGLLDPGFQGHVTLEVMPLAHDIYVSVGQHVGVIVYHKMITPSEEHYLNGDHHYVNQGRDPVIPYDVMSHYVVDHTQDNN